MRPGYKGALALAVALAAVALGTAGCGYSPGTTGDEGTPIDLGNMEFNVQLTRFLNPSDAEDNRYLAGQQLPAASDKAYLAVFMTMKNKGDTGTAIPATAQMTITDTTGASYQAVPSSTPFAAPLGTPLAGGAEIPVPDSPAASGPAQGSVVLFYVPQGINENRPLDLEIQHQGETGTITLDI
jgi:hypothetical protein